MNSLVGKSTGIALLMAAALLAALFAMGVFSASGVGAHEGDHCDGTVTTMEGGDTTCTTGHDDIHPGVISEVSVELSSALPGATGVTMTIEFTPGGASETDRTIQITVPLATDGTADETTFGGAGTLVFSGDDANVKATQGENSLSLAAGTSPANIAITHDAASDAVNYVAGQPITVEITGLTNPSDASSGTADAASNHEIDIRQIGSTEEATQNLGDEVSRSAGVNLSSGSLTLSSKTAGAAVQVVLNLWAVSAKGSANDITVDLKKFGVPTTIPERAVIIADDNGNGADDTGEEAAAAAAYDGEPGTVTVNGTKVTLALNSRIPGSGGEAGNLINGYTITFKQSAGITNPKKAGTATVEVDDGDEPNHSVKEAIESKVTLDKTSGPRGTTVTVKGVGFNTGDATVYLTSQYVDDIFKVEDYRLVEASVASDNTFSAEIDTTAENFIHGAEPNTKGDAFRGLNRIHVVDAAGTEENVAAYFEVTATLNPQSSGKRGGKVKVSVADFAYGAISNIKIGDKSISSSDRSGSLDDGAGTITITIPNDARLGEQVLTFEGSSTSDQQGTPGDDNVDSAKGKIVIGALDLSITPSTAVIGQIIRIEGSGFADNECITEITVGPDRPITEATSGDKVGARTDGTCLSDAVESDGNGNLANSFRVPLGLKAATYRVTVTSQSGRIGTTDMVVPKPSISLDTDESQRGTNVVVEGTDFPAEDTVLVKYAIRGGDTKTVGATTTDTIGRFRTTIEVPVTATIGEEHEVRAESTDKADGNTVDDVVKPLLSAKTPHSIPDEVLELSSPSAAPGQRLTLTATNLPLFAVVSVTIGGVGVAATDQSRVDGFIATDGTGSFSETVLVPQLTAGTHPVEVTAGRGDTAVQVIRFLDVVSVITRQSEDAFADLIANGTLTRVWHLDRETQKWTFYDPDPEIVEFSDLTEVTSGQIVTIIMNAQDQFQGQTLFVGSNPIAIE